MNHLIFFLFAESVVYFYQIPNIRRTPTSDFIKPQENVPHILALQFSPEDVPQLKFSNIKIKQTFSCLSEGLVFDTFVCVCVSSCHVILD